MAVIAIFIACCNNRIGELVAIRGLCLSVFALFEDAKKNHELSFPYFSPSLIPLLSLPENVRIDFDHFRKRKWTVVVRRKKSLERD